MAPAPPSPDDAVGYWGPPTSTLDWCEENYVSSYYIAEYWNTITNLVMIVLPIISSIIMWKEKVEMRFIWANIALLVVGVGSWCFHMTLLYRMQLLDELPMVWGSVAIVYIGYECFEKPGKWNKLLVGSLVIYCALTTVIYLTVINPLFHQVAYGFLVFLLIGRGIYLLRYMYITSFFGLSYRLYQTFTQHHRRYYGGLFLYIYCLGCYVLAFILWNIDNNVCPSIRSLRKSVPFPLSAVTQLHGWWHIFTGLSTHCYIVMMCHYRSNYLRQENYLKYTAGVVPFVHHPNKGQEMNHNM